MSVTFLNGDAIDELSLLPDESVDCVVTSPPYWGLRDYGVAGQIGLETTLGEHLAALVTVFREVRRVLKKSGTCWVNYGDAYATGTSAPRGPTTTQGDHVPSSWANRCQKERIGTPPGFKTKDRMLLPARLAIALQEDGWWVRDEIIWHKPNPMPSSVKDRTTPAHEMIYLLTKAERYFYDSVAIKEAVVVPGWDNGMRVFGGKNKSGANVKCGGRTTGRLAERKRGLTPRHEGQINHTTLNEFPRGEGRNKRSVWTVAPKPFKEAHFATFPPDLIEPCILAGCPVGGTVLDPFGGAGTTALVAEKHGRNAVLIELNPDYIAIAKKRLGVVGPSLEDMLG